MPAAAAPVVGALFIDFANALWTTLFLWDPLPPVHAGEIDPGLVACEVQALITAAPRRTFLSLRSPLRGRADRPSRGNAQRRASRTQALWMSDVCQ